MGTAPVATRGMALAQALLLINTVTDRVQGAGHAILRDAAWPAYHAVLNGCTGLHTNSDGDVVIQLFSDKSYDVWQMHVAHCVIGVGCAAFEKGRLCKVRHLQPSEIAANRATYPSVQTVNTVSALCILFLPCVRTARSSHNNNQPGQHSFEFKRLLLLSTRTRRRPAARIPWHRVVLCLWPCAGACILPVPVSCIPAWPAVQPAAAAARGATDAAGQ